MIALIVFAIVLAGAGTAVLCCAAAQWHSQYCAGHRDVGLQCEANGAPDAAELWRWLFW